MSDFDKEAEREKLRKKYERDKEEREATQRMSDLLLKGARMTNTHCTACGDPLFQQKGVTFCPTCHGSPEAVEGTPLEEGDEPGTSDPDPATKSADEGTSNDAGRKGADAGRGEADAGRGGADDNRGVVDADRVEADDVGEDATGDGIDDGPVTAHGSGPQRDSPSEGRRETRRNDRHARSESERRNRGSSSARNDHGRGSAPPAAAGDSETIRESLANTLERFVREAERSDDPRYARECLEAAREAAATMSELPR